MPEWKGDQAPRLFSEGHIAQMPALQLLINLGYHYLTPEEALALRGGNTANVILEPILERQLRKINRVEHKGQEYSFSNPNIQAAIEAVKDIPYDGLLKTNEKIYHLLALGKAMKETIQGNTRSYMLRYIDWENVENNVFHVTPEFAVDRADHRSRRRPDIVLFVNGIPFGVIECKSPHIKDALSLAIGQQLRNQQDDEIPRLFIYSQILMVSNKNEMKYATVGSDPQYWFTWREQRDVEKHVYEAINRRLPSKVKEKLFSRTFGYAPTYFTMEVMQGRLVTEQDRTIFALLCPSRLLELTYQFVLFDANEKKIARYPQYFAVKRMIKRLKQVDSSGKRRGGVIWHTQGSGKSLTMVMLARALALEPQIENPRIVLVSDRINLDKQIFKTFKHCGMEPVKARTGRNLIELLEKEKKTVITTVIDKFHAAFNKKTFKNRSSEIFALVDESHRSQYGKINAKMMKVLPNACYLGFTGTPLMKKDKNTAQKFGGFIDKYTIDQGVADKAIVPLLYEGRLVTQQVNQEPIDRWADRVCQPLPKYTATQLKRKFSSPEKLHSAEQKIREIAYDVSIHFKKNLGDTPFKAQLAAISKHDAIKFKKYFDEIGLVTSEVLISAPEVREGHENSEDEISAEVRLFWKKMMGRFGNEKEYNEQLIDSFTYGDKPNIIIVVDKLLTGFNAPRNAVLYIARNFHGHTLLQAIARVNRIYPGKDYGHIIDYRGILANLDRALVEYRALSEFDQEDLEGTLHSVKDVIRSLPQKHAELWDIFKSIRDRQDEEEFEHLLFDEALRHRFYEKLTEFARILSTALSTHSVYEDIPDSILEKYLEDLKFFAKLRESVKRRYAETIDFKEYEQRFQKLLDTYVSADEVKNITKLVNIFDRQKFEAEVNKVTGTAARADIIAHRTKRSIEEKYDEDPVFYEKFSRLLQKAIEDYQNARLTEAEYFLKARNIMESVRDRKGDDIPEILQDRDSAKAFYGIIHQVLAPMTSDSTTLASLGTKAALAIERIVEKHLVVDWRHKQDVQNAILNEMEDYLYELKEKQNLSLDFDQIDLIMETVLNISKRRYPE